MSTIPAELIQLDQWVVHIDKVPVQAKPLLRDNIAYGASSTKAWTWCAYGAAAQAAHEYPCITGAGFMFKRGGGITGIDYDKCLNDAGQLLDWAEPLVRPFMQMGAYIEISPSGHGLKCWVHGTLPEDGRGRKFKFTDAAGVHIVEMYCQDREFTVTGNRYHDAGSTILDAQPQIDTLYTTLDALKTANAHHHPTCTRTHAPGVVTAPVDAADIHDLLDRTGYPRRLAFKSQTRRILSDARARARYQKPGSSDPDWSTLRYIVTKGLRMHGYDDRQVKGFCILFESVLNGSKTHAAFCADIDRLIRSLDPVQDKPTEPEPRNLGGRPRRNRDTLLERYRNEPALCDLNRRPRARALGIPVPTLDRMEAELKQRGAIRIELLDKRAGSRVIVLGVIKTPASDVLPEACTEVLSNADSDTQNTRAESGQTRENANANDRGNTRFCSRLSPIDLARTFFASAADPLTGEVWERHTFARFKRFAESQGTYHPAALSRAFASEQKRLRWTRRDERLMETARTLRSDTLNRKSRSASSRAADLHHKNSTQAPVWDRIAGIYAAEEARRTPALDLTTHELWADVDMQAYDQARRDIGLKGSKRGHGTGKACSPPSLPDSVPSGVYSSRDLIARLRARLEDS